ncbi:hypothetical protein ACH5RR_006900 [Cinchona calisaya]|uniref:Uncharacterized protein n=1 Tax=Cinchona calisaya TaxID=153742 RepID=A0ABD3AQE1_9GENT
MPRKEKVNVISSKGHDCNEVESSFEEDIACDATEPNGDAQSVEHSMGENLLKNLKLAPLDRIQNVLQEATSVYQSIEHLDGNPSILKSIVGSFVSIVATYMRINELSMVASKKQKAIKQLEEARFQFATLKKEHGNCSNVLIAVCEEIMSLKMKERELTKDLENKVEAMEAVAASVKLAEEPVNKEGTNLVMIAEDEKKLEDLKEEALNYQRSLNPSAWMGIDTQSCFLSYYFLVKTCLELKPPFVSYLAFLWKCMTFFKLI